MASMNYFLSEDVTWWENEGHRRLSDILHCKLIIFTTGLDSKRLKDVILELRIFMVAISVLEILTWIHLVGV
jgi:hypothetical protein